MSKIINPSQKELYRTEYAQIFLDEALPCFVIRTCGYALLEERKHAMNYLISVMKSHRLGLFISDLSAAEGSTVGELTPWIMDDWIKRAYEVGYLGGATVVPSDFFVRKGIDDIQKNAADRNFGQMFIHETFGDFGMAVNWMKEVIQSLNGKLTRLDELESKHEQA